MSIQLQLEMETLGQVIMELMGQHAPPLKGIQVAEKTGMTSTQISRILNNHDRPHTANFEKIISAVATNPSHADRLRRAYYGPDFEEGLSFIQHPESEKIEESTTTYKTLIDPFQGDVEEILIIAKIPYNKRVQRGNFDCDFITRTKTRIAIHLKPDVRADWPDSLGHAMYIKENFKVDRVLVVIPYHTPTSEQQIAIFEKMDILIVAPADLAPTLKRLGA